MSVSLKTLQANKFELATAIFWVLTSIFVLLDAVIYSLRSYIVALNLGINIPIYLVLTIISFLGFITVGGLVYVSITPINKNLFTLLAITTSILSFILFSIWIVMGEFIWTNIVAFILGIPLILSIILDYKY